MLMRILLGLSMLGAAAVDLQAELNSLAFITITTTENNDDQSLSAYHYNLHGFRCVWNYSIFKFDIGYKGRLVREFSNLILDIKDKALKKTKKDNEETNTWKHILSAAHEFHHVHIKIGNFATVFYGILNPAHLPSGVFVDTFKFGTYNLYKPFQAGSITDQAIKVFMLTLLTNHPILDSISILYNISHCHALIGRFTHFSSVDNKDNNDASKKHKIKQTLFGSNTPQALTFADHIKLATLIFRTIFDNSIGTSIYKLFLSTEFERCTASFTQHIDEPNAFLSSISFGGSLSQWHLQLDKGRLSCILLGSRIRTIKESDTDPIHQNYIKKHLDEYQKGWCIFGTLVYHIPVHIAHSLYFGVSVCLHKDSKKSWLAKDSMSFNQHEMSLHFLFGLCQNKDSITKEIILKR